MELGHLPSSDKYGRPLDFMGEFPKNPERERQPGWTSDSPALLLPSVQGASVKLESIVVNLNLL